MDAGSRQRGFTLIEMLAAFVVFALGFAVMMDVDAKIEPGVSSGKFDRKYRWDMQVSEWEPPADAARFETTAPLEMYRIEVVVRWGSGDTERSSKFVTVRAVQPGVGG